MPQKHLDGLFDGYIRPFHGVYTGDSDSHTRLAFVGCMRDDEEHIVSFNIAPLREKVLLYFRHIFACPHIVRLLFSF